MSNSQLTKRTSSIHNSNDYLSEIELKILRSHFPIQINDKHEITYNNQKNMWLNKNESNSRQGHLKIDNYSLNQDSDPIIIKKKSNKELEYIQELAIQYLKPPTPVSPPKIIIKQNSNILTPPAPPLAIREKPINPNAPQRLVISELPSQPPPKVEPKVVTISGKKLPPQPRKITIERLPQLPSKPSTIIVERWLPYNTDKRRVIFQRSKSPALIVKDPKNVIVDWQPPEVEIEKHYSFLGVVEADPNEYVKKYGNKLKKLEDYPELKAYIKKSNKLFENENDFTEHELEGDIEALKLVDLEKEGLNKYRDYIQNFDQKVKKSSAYDLKTNNFLKNLLRSDLSSLKTSNSVEFFIDQVFESLSNYNNAKITYDNARNIFVKYSAKHGKKFNDKDFISLLRQSNLKHKSSFDLNELKRLFLNSN